MSDQLTKMQSRESSRGFKQRVISLFRRDVVPIPKGLLKFEHGGASESQDHNNACYVLDSAGKVNMGVIDARSVARAIEFRTGLKPSQRDGSVLRYGAKEDGNGSWNMSRYGIYLEVGSDGVRMESDTYYFGDRAYAGVAGKKFELSERLMWRIAKALEAGNEAQN